MNTVPTVLSTVPAPSSPSFPSSPPSTNYVWYLKWTVIVGILVFLYILLRPYFIIFVKMIELIRVFLTKSIDFTGDIGKDIVDEAAVGSKLVVNKISKPSAKANQSELKSGYCYVGEEEGVRHCTRVDKSYCSSKLYSTESQCVAPSLQ
jgi:hypothetical protein